LPVADALLCVERQKQACKLVQRLLAHSKWPPKGRGIEYAGAAIFQADSRFRSNPQVVNNMSGSFNGCVTRHAHRAVIQVSLADMDINDPRSKLNEPHGLPDTC